MAIQVACGSGSTSTPSNASLSPGSSAAASQPTAVPTENNPAGDIPDNQAFVKYHSDAGGYTLDTPEGWARSVSGMNASLSDKLLGIVVDIASATSAPSVDSVTANELPLVGAQVEAFEKVSVEEVDLPSGKAVRVRYRANSAPDAVTGKKVRLEVDRYEIYKNGKLAALSLSAPAGSDNVDVWNRISASFTWD
jgi:hypothetical protein